MVSSDLFGYKRKQLKEQVEPSFGYEDRAELLDDLLEDDESSFPLLEAPREVLAAIGACLDARNLAALSELCRAAQQLEAAFEEAWNCLLMRDHLPKNRAKRYQRGASNSWVSASPSASAGVVLRALDVGRVEWDGLLLMAPPQIRYRYLQSTGVLRLRWGRHANSWDWLATRVLRRTTFSQLERSLPGFTRPSVAEPRDQDDVLWQADLDRQARKRHAECHHTDAIASVKRKLGLTADVAQAQAQVSAAKQERGADEAAEAEEDLAALAPTARDQRLQAAAEAAAPAAAAPSREAVERMSFAEQMDLALRMSRAAEPEEEAAAATLATPAPAAPEAADEEDKDAEGVLLRLVQPAVAGTAAAEPLQVVLRASSAGEENGLQGQLRHNCEQIALKLTRADWLLLYEGVALEAQLRARTLAYQLRQRQPDVKGAVQLFDLEAVLLQLPIFGAPGSSPEAAVSAAAEACKEAGLDTSEGEEEASLRDFLQTWEDYEAWAASLEEHLGPLDLEVSRERSNNLQRGQSHTPYVVDLCRLAFRNFAICEGRLFVLVALALYSLIARALRDDPERDMSEGFKDRGGRHRAGQEAHGRHLALLEALHNVARPFAVQDDALALQRSTLEEYRYYLLEPLERACQHFDLLEEN